jgi:hypothetical protein
MPQTLVISDPAARRFDVFQQALVRSWKDCGSDVAWVTLITSDVLEIVDLDPGEPVAHALSHLARRARAA